MKKGVSDELMDLNQKKKGACCDLIDRKMIIYKPWRGLKKKKKIKRIARCELRGHDMITYGQRCGLQEKKKKDSWITKHHVPVAGCHLADRFGLCNS